MKYQYQNNGYPDIIALLKNNHVAIIEVKSITAMDHHQNIEKYRALAQYCMNEDYEYMMIDPAYDYMTFEEFQDMKVIAELAELFDNMCDGIDEDNPEKLFDKTDVDRWYEEYGDGYTRKEFDIQVHSLVAYCGLYNKKKNGFDVYSGPVKNSIP